MVDRRDRWHRPAPDAGHLAHGSCTVGHLHLGPGRSILDLGPGKPTDPPDLHWLLHPVVRGGRLGSHDRGVVPQVAAVVRAALGHLPGHLQNRGLEDGSCCGRSNALPGSGRSLGHDYGDAVVDDHCRGHRTRHRDPIGSVGGPLVAGGSLHKTGPGRHADHSRSGLLHSDRPLLRDPTGSGHHRHRHLLTAAGGETDHPRHRGCAPSIGGGGRDVRLHATADSVQGAVADGDALHHDRGQPDDHDGPGHRRPRHAARSRRAGPGSARSAESATHRARAGRWTGHRGGGDGAGPSGAVTRLRRPDEACFAALRDYRVGPGHWGSRPGTGHGLGGIPGGMGGQSLRPGGRLRALGPGQSHLHYSPGQ